MTQTALDRYARKVAKMDAATRQYEIALLESRIQSSHEADARMLTSHGMLPTRSAQNNRRDLAQMIAVLRRPEASA